jgi:hypothetical protein
VTVKASFPTPDCNGPDRDEIARVVGRADSWLLEVDVADALRDADELDRYEETARWIREVRETEKSDE